LENANKHLRYGTPVRFLAPRNEPITSAVAPTRLIFPKYHPAATASCSPLTTEQSLQLLIESDTVIRDLTQKKLEALCDWISRIPAYSITYPDLVSGVSVIRGILNQTNTDPTQ
jgi:hypothetical protein